MMYVCDINVECPACDTKFSITHMPVLLDTGYRNSELRQDFKGKIPNFENYSVCTCPGCGLADWINRFPSTTQPTTLTQVKAPAHVQFRSAALSAERSGRSFFTVGLFYLYAAWCADDSGLFIQSKEYRRLAVDAFRKSLLDASCPSEQRMEIEYLIGELLRRAGEFEASQAYFKQVIPQLSSHYAITARRLMKLADLGATDAIDLVKERA